MRTDLSVGEALLTKSWVGDGKTIATGEEKQTEV